MIAGKLVAGVTAVMVASLIAPKSSISKDSTKKLNA
jgi:ethanolamine transporter EutH